jgi:2-C-methyl-D-erythritol 2,4-cyclodiphosphate synthase
LAKERGFAIANIDSTIHLERPKLRDRIDEMRTGIADALEIESSAVSIKAKTSEGVDAVGEAKAIRADAVVLLVKGE